MTNPGDDQPLSSDEMLRRAREGLSQPTESAMASPEPPPPPPVASKLQRPAAKVPRLRPPPPVTPANPAAKPSLVAVAIVIALVGAGVAFFIAMAASGP
jgi:hypothetical protein